jgi:hypothetical protein
VDAPKAVAGSSLCCHRNAPLEHSGDPAGSISYTADATDVNAAELRLFYTRREGTEPKQMRQTGAAGLSRAQLGRSALVDRVPLLRKHCGKLYLLDGVVGSRARRGAVSATLPTCHTS